MGSEDMRRQRLNVDRMRLLGAEVVRGRRRQPHAQGRHQRGDARLGDQRAHHPLHPRLGARSRSLPAHGPRLPPGDRRGGARSAAASRRGAPTPTWRSPASAAARNSIGLFWAFLERNEGAPDRRRGRRLGAAARASTRRASTAAASACSTAPARWCCRTRTARWRTPTRCRPASTIRRWVPSTCWLRDHGRVEYTRGVRRRGGRGLPSLRAHRRHPARPRERARAGGGHQARAAAGQAIASCWSTSRAAATRTSSRCSSGTPRRAPAPAGGGRRPAQRRRASATWPFIRAPPGPPRARRGGSREDAVVSTLRQSHRGGVRALPPREARRLHPVHHGGRSATRDCCPTWCARWSPAAPTSSSSAFRSAIPIADGPVNQRAATRAIAGGTTLSGILQRVAEIARRARDAARPLHLLQPHPSPRRRALRRAGGGVGNRRRAVRRPAARRGGGGDRADLRAPRDRPHLPAGADLERRAHQERGARRRAGSSTTRRAPAVTGEQTRLPAELLGDLRQAATPASSCRSRSASASRRRSRRPRSAGVADGVIVGSHLVRLIEEHGADGDLPARLEARVRELAGATRPGALEAMEAW